MLLRRYKTSQQQEKQQVVKPQPAVKPVVDDKPVARRSRRKKVDADD